MAYRAWTLYRRLIQRPGPSIATYTELVILLTILNEGVYNWQSTKKLSIDFSSKVKSSSWDQPVPRIEGNVFVARVNNVSLCRGYKLTTDNESLRYTTPHVDARDRFGHVHLYVYHTAIGECVLNGVFYQWTCVCTIIIIVLREQTCLPFRNNRLSTDHCWCAAVTA